MTTIYIITVTVYAAVVTYGFMRRGQECQRAIVDIDRLTEELEDCNDCWREHYRRGGKRLGGRLGRYSQ